jgi:hypothetical protein
MGSDLAATLLISELGLLNLEMFSNLGFSLIDFLI